MARHKNSPRLRRKPYRVDPLCMSSAPSKHFTDLSQALDWARKVARRFRVHMTVCQVGDNGRAVCRIPIEP